MQSPLLEIPHPCRPARSTCRHLVLSTDTVDARICSFRWSSSLALLLSFVGSRSAQVEAGSRPRQTYFLFSLASATFDCCPASDTAFRNASVLAGAGTLPERMLRNIICFP